MRLYRLVPDDWMQFVTDVPEHPRTGEAHRTITDLRLLRDALASERQHGNAMTCHRAAELLAEAFGEAT